VSLGHLTTAKTNGTRKRGRPKIEGRRQELLDAAARYFCAHGYDAASMRDIAAEAGILVGSIYHHFSSKEELFIEVFLEGLRRTTLAVVSAVDPEQDPWTQLEQACIAHVDKILSKDDFVQIADYEFPHRHTEAVRKRIIPRRDAYEKIFKDLIDKLPLRRGVNKKYLRLTLFGAMSWTLIWYRAGRDSPAMIAARVVDIVRHGAELKKGG
jgi:AcrR family transcriptional regulator